MKVTILFTSSTNWGSVLIRRATREPVSHVALEFAGLVLQASGGGVGILSSSEFRAAHEVRFSLSVETSPEAVFSGIAKTIGQPYDWGALFYCGLKVLFPSLPNRNLWNSSGNYLCTEVAQKFLGLSDNPLVTPYQLYLQLIKNGVK